MMSDSILPAWDTVRIAYPELLPDHSNRKRQVSSEHDHGAAKGAQRSEWGDCEWC